MSTHIHAVASIIILVFRWSYNYRVIDSEVFVYIDMFLNVFYLANRSLVVPTAKMEISMVDEFLQRYG